MTVGKPEVIINGESRPLDVPPMIYQGVVLVPVRVISEGMGAYVQWVPDKRLVVVRYIPATPPPSPAPPPPRTAAAAAADAGPEARRRTSSSSRATISSRRRSTTSSRPETGATARGRRPRRRRVQRVRGLPFMLEVDYKNWQYPHNCGVPHQHSGDQQRSAMLRNDDRQPRTRHTCRSFTAVNRDVDVRLGFKVFDPHVYIAVGYMWWSNNYGYPNMNAVGLGLEKLPDFGHAFTYYGSVYYYPNFNGTYITGANRSSRSQSFGIGYNLLKYQVGIAWAFVPRSIRCSAGPAKTAPTRTTRRSRTRSTDRTSVSAS